jgi:hypothetical protein
MYTAMVGGDAHALKLIYNGKIMVDNSIISEFADRLVMMIAMFPR